MPDSSPSSDVVIVGGGPVGTGLAIDLAQRGIRSILVERYPEPQPIPRGQNLTQRTMEHFHFWGCEAALRAARTVPRDYGIGGLTAYGTLLSGHAYDWLQRELVRPFYFTDNERLPQYATEAVLRRRAAALPEIETLYGWSAEGATQDAAGVRVDIAARDGSGRRELRAAYAVGCDGSRSVVREAAGITQTRQDHDRLMVLLVFRSHELHRLLERFPGKSFYNVLHPELKGYWRFFGRVDLGTTWFFHAPVPPGTTRDNYDFSALLHESVGAPFDVAIEHVGFWDLRFATADSYRAGRLFIAGDAAHSHPPYGGYGINTGFEDAANLGWKLAAALEGWAGPGLLDSYTAERRPVFVSTARDFIERAIRDDREFLEAHDPARDPAAFEAAWAARGSGAKSEVGAYAPHYAGSPIVPAEPGLVPGAAGTHAVAARAGRHLTPLPLSDGRNVYEALGPGFTLLAIGDGRARAAAFARAAAALGVPLGVIEDPGSADLARYEADLILVRPDQFVAFAGAGPAGDPAAILARAVGGRAP
ncbi:FAD-dependent oxidoreductase [Methylobacterium platani]|uniref:Monooxygenase n=2 Tax=Methylobacterium platani TaxID=427683 RepID=A0A179S1T6_9HYPH|nr:FAD-dependent oxidoreductase [Methylobacterium platani]KMO10510.1 monooxygenase [Methylobacterium platani JCM 14648]OAS19599.1 monooxygenase [Methylobacterium platani]